MNICRSHCPYRTEYALYQYHLGSLKEIYGSRRANVQKADWYRTVDAPSGAFSTHSEIDRGKHAFRRRVLDHAFSDSALRSAEPFVRDNVRLW